MAASGGHWTKSSSGRAMFRTSGGEIGGALWIGEAVRQRGAIDAVNSIRRVAHDIRMSFNPGDSEVSYKEKLEQREKELRLKIEQTKARLESQPLRDLKTFAPGATIVDEAGRAYRVKSLSAKTALLEPLWGASNPTWGKAERVSLSKRARPVDMATIEFLRGKMKEG